MKKIGMALIMADMLLCLLLAAGSGFRRSQEGERAALSEAARERAQERQQEQEQEVRRIAITFEDEGIIGTGRYDNLTEKGTGERFALPVPFLNCSV